MYMSAFHAKSNILFFFSKKNGFFSAGTGENAPAAPKNNGWRSTAITHYFSSGRDKKTFENADNHSP